MLETQKRTKSDTKAADKGGEREGGKRCTAEEEEEGQAGEGGREGERDETESRDSVQ